jgi:hypothetical protein
MRCVTSRKVVGLIDDEVIGFLNLPNASSGTMALRSTEISTRELSGGKGYKPNNLTAISEPIV